MGLFTLSNNYGYQPLSDRLKTRFPEENLRKIQANLEIIAYKLNQLRNNCLQVNELGQEELDEAKYLYILFLIILLFNFNC